MLCVRFDFSSLFQRHAQAQVSAVRLFARSEFLELNGLERVSRGNEIIEFDIPQLQLLYAQVSLIVGGRAQLLFVGLQHALEGAFVAVTVEKVKRRMVRLEMIEPPQLQAGQYLCFSAGGVRHCFLPRPMMRVAQCDFDIQVVELGAELKLLPLSSCGGSCVRGLGGLTTKGAVYRFELAVVTPNTVALAPLS